VPAAAVTPAPIAYANVVALKKLVVRCAAARAVSSGRRGGMGSNPAAADQRPQRGRLGPMRRGSQPPSPRFL